MFDVILSESMTSTDLSFTCFTHFSNLNFARTNAKFAMGGGGGGVFNFIILSVGC